MNSDYGWNRLGIGYAIEHPGYNGDGNGFLNYDGTFSYLDDPPNQHYQIFNFRFHASRFAHELDAAMGHHSLTECLRRELVDHLSNALFDDRECLGQIS